MKILNSKISSGTPQLIDSEYFFYMSDTEDYIISVGRKVAFSFTSFSNTIAGDITFRFYASTSPKTPKNLIATEVFTPAEAGKILYHKETFIPCYDPRVYYYISVQAGSGEALASYSYELYDTGAGLDIATVNDASPVSAADIADVILETPENLLATNPNGSVKGAGGGRLA